MQLSYLSKVCMHRCTHCSDCQANPPYVGLGRVVREVRQHPEDHEFESQRWQ
jgi:hypothetical protein